MMGAHLEQAVHSCAMHHNIDLESQVIVKNHA
jgi:hypothetical protein